MGLRKELLSFKDLALEEWNKVEQMRMVEYFWKIITTDRFIDGVLPFWTNAFLEQIVAIFNF